MSDVQTSCENWLRARPQRQPKKGACELLATALATDPKDVPFALLYVVAGDGKSAALLGSTGIPVSSPMRAAMEEVSEDMASQRWPLSGALRNQAPVVVSKISERFDEVPVGPWPEPVTQAIILPAVGVGEDAVKTLLVLGINPRRALDGEYRRFMALISSHVASTLASARAHEKLQIVLSSITDGLAVLDKNWKYTYFSEQAARIIGMRPEELLGRCVWDLFPNAQDTEFYRGYHRAVESRLSVHFEEYYPHPLNKWLECYCYPSEAGLSVYFHDITKRKNAENDLRDANAQLAHRATHLEALVQQRTVKLMETIGELEAFSYSIAHDMRAPLRSLQGYSTILTTDFAPQLESEAQEYLHRIARSASRMDKLIQDVLNYSRVVRADLPLEPVDVEQLLRGILDTYPMFAADKASVSVQRPFSAVLGNEAMLMQIFSNLMGNAVKFVAPGLKPSIKIWAENVAPMVRLYVQDNGIGIAPDQHDKIFQIFQQVERNAEGTGIGLAIVKKAVERMGGKVGLISHLGQGSTFWIELCSASTDKP
jgi:PAS domain S-box-containing protein